jgi:hypothetical protein
LIDLIQKKHSGSYYTKPEIVSLILDLVGYTEDKPLYNFSLLEPSSGEGAFLIPAVERLLTSLKLHLGFSKLSQDEAAYSLLKDSIRSIEVNDEKHTILYTKLERLLQKNGASFILVKRLLDKWLVKADFLYWNQPVEKRFDFIVGNPPYIRIENINENDSIKYRNIYKTLYDRADIYVAFIEHGLEMLANKGRLGFICTDRFTKNRYGKEIRRLINDNYNVVHFLDIHNSQPFIDDVSAYPCIFTIENSDKSVSRTLYMDKLTPIHLQAAKAYLLKGVEPERDDIATHTIEKWFKGSAPWILNGTRAQKILDKLESHNPLISDEPHNIKIGIGVATGANDIYIIHPDKVDIEPELLLPTVTKDDIKTGVIQWRGYYVINPYKADGSLIDLNDYPKLKRYFTYHESVLKERSTAKKSPDKWYKTIDRIFPERLKEAKLLIPDIKSKNLIVLDKGEFYPEHSLYYLCGGTWDIYALQALLSSSVIKFFIWSYATKMRGDYLRYQAQYLRKIRLPVGIDNSIIENLKSMYQRGDWEGIDYLAQRIYNLSNDELREIQELVD